MPRVPRRHLYGTARDQLIGVTVVTADGALVRGGGKVVKNVAGYDLPKLFVGSYGTLGILVEVTVRLRPVPESERWVCVPFDRLKDAGAAVRLIMGSDLIPSAVELLDGDASRAFGAGGTPALVVGFDGLAEQVDWQCAELAAITGPLGGRGVLPLAGGVPPGGFCRARVDGRRGGRRALQRPAHPGRRADGAGRGRGQAARTQDLLDGARRGGGRHGRAGVPERPARFEGRRLRPRRVARPGPLRERPRHPGVGARSP